MYLVSHRPRKTEVIIRGKCGTGPGTIAVAPAGIGEVIFSGVPVAEKAGGVDGTLAERGSGGVSGGSGRMGGEPGRRVF